MNKKGYTIEQIADVTEKCREEVEAVLENEKYCAAALSRDSMNT